MNTNVIIALVAIVLLGGAIWYFSGNDAPEAGTDTEGEEQATTNEQLQEQEAAGREGLGTFAELMALGQSFTCDFRSEHEGGSSEGTVYIDGSGERYMLDGQYAQDGESGTFSAIVDNEVMYWWGETPEGRMGMKMDIPEGEEPETTPEAFGGTSAAVSPDEEVEYDCDPWRVDASVFVPPSDVEFTDMQAMMEEMMQGMPEGFEMPENMQ